MRKYTTILATVLSGTLLLGAAVAQMDHGNMPGMNSTPKSSGTSGMNMQGMTMDMTAMQKLNGRAFDRAFLSMMIPHHQMAVEMSKAVLPSAKDATVKKWANQIIADQNREIGQMTAWLKTLGGTDAKMQASMKTSMAGMADSVKNARDKQTAFVQGMIPHHASAIEMATMALQKSTDDRVLKLARDIVRAQAQEIYDFKQWLKKS